MFYFFLKILCRVPPFRRSAKFEYFFKNKLFAEYRGHYTRQNWENGFPSTRQSD